jgi:DNA topoisomerase-3
MLIIWTDCDREGENIGAEIVEVCRAANPRIAVYRARFSEITRNAVTRAMNNLVRMDQRTIDAVNCRMELDLRTGSSLSEYREFSFFGISKFFFG